MESLRLPGGRLHERADDPEQREEDPQEEHPSVPVSQRPDSEPDEEDDPEKSAEADSPPHSVPRELLTGLAGAVAACATLQADVATGRRSAISERRPLDAAARQLTAAASCTSSAPSAGERELGSGADDETM